MENEVRERFERIEGVLSGVGSQLHAMAGILHRTLEQAETTSARLDKLTESIQMLEISQQLTDEKLRNLIDALREGRNGHAN